MSDRKEFRREPQSLTQTAVSEAVPIITPPRIGLAVRILVYLLVATVLLLVAFLISADQYLRQVSRDLQADGKETAENVLTRLSTSLEDQIQEAYRVQAVEEARRLDGAFREVERSVAMLADAASVEAEGPRPGTAIALPWTAFNSPGEKPQDLRFDPARGVQISWKWPVFHTPKGVSPLSPSLARLSPLRDLMVLLARNHKDLPWIYVASSDGVFVGVPGNGNFTDDFDARQRSWFRGAMVSPGRTHWTQPYVDVLTGRLTVTCSRTFSHGGSRLAGVAAADLSLETIRAWLGDVASSHDGRAILVDGGGLIVGDARGDGEEDPNQEPRKFADQGDARLQDVMKQMFKGESGFARVALSGVEMFLAHAPIPTAGWHLAVLYPADRFREIRTQNAEMVGSIFGSAEATTAHRVDDLQQRFVLAMVLACVLLMGTVGAILTLRLTRPVTAMIREVHAIAGGDLAREVPVTAQDEIGHLATAFNEMSRQLRRTRDELRENYRTLERKVEERTRELASRNLELNRLYREREQAYRQLQGAQAQLIHQERMATLGQLVAGIAHEINNPVNYLVNSVRPLQKAVEKIRNVLNLYEQVESLPPEEAQERLWDIQRYKREARFDVLLRDLDTTLELIRNGGTRTSQIVQNLRTFSRTDPTETRDTDLAQAIDITLSLLNHLIKGRIEVHREFDNIGRIKCNPGHMNQVLMNLLTNAAQAIRGTGEIWIYLRREGPWVRIVVRDNGCGIPEDMLYRVFEPFFTTKEAPHGTGLGLSISLSLVQQHGGTIEVRSAVGVGTELTVSIPVEPGAVEEAALASGKIKPVALSDLMGEDDTQDSIQVKPKSKPPGTPQFP